jgi:hypothetical protein
LGIVPVKEVVCALYAHKNDKFVWEKQNLEIFAARGIKYLKGSFDGDYWDLKGK